MTISIMTSTLKRQVLTCLQKSLKKLLDEDTVVLDTQNDYEYDLGHFRGAIRPDIRNFSWIATMGPWCRKNSWTSVLSSTVSPYWWKVRVGWEIRRWWRLQRCWSIAQGIATYGKDPEVQVSVGWENGRLWRAIAVDVNHVDPSVVGKIGLMEHHANVMSTTLSIKEKPFDGSWSTVEIWRKRR